MTARMDPGTAHEEALYAGGASIVAGIDEVGRGAWAGPLSVGVVALTRDALGRLPGGVRDSKMLSPLARSKVFEPLRAAVSSYGLGHASAEECDALGMTAAQLLATDRAFAVLGIEPDAVIVDGKFDFTRRSDTVTIVGADRLCLVVAAASVLAKVTRDEMMVAQAPQYPHYHFERNKGYPSPDHRAALSRFGLSGIHRRSWSFAAALAQ